MTLSEIPMNVTATGRRYRTNVDEVMGWAGGIWGRVGGGIPHYASSLSYTTKIPRRDAHGVVDDDDDNDDEEVSDDGDDDSVEASLAETPPKGRARAPSSDDDDDDDDDGGSGGSSDGSSSAASSKAQQRQTLVKAKAKALAAAGADAFAGSRRGSSAGGGGARTSGRAGAGAKRLALARNPAVNISYDGAIRPFPESVHAMVTETAAEDPTLIAWVRDGEAFAVKDTGPRLAPVLQKFFRHTKYSSLQRQLNIYGWTKCTDGRYKGAFYNPEFHRDADKANLAGIVRRPPPSRQRGVGYKKAGAAAGAAVKSSSKKKSSKLAAKEAASTKKRKRQEIHTL